MWADGRRLAEAALHIFLHPRLPQPPVNPLKSGDVVLVKAPRSVGLEKFADLLQGEVPA
jgi:UDP-N-acetylmuramyl pentapeptide synthase